MAKSVTVPLKEFSPAVSFVASFAAKKGTVPALQHVYFAPPVDPSIDGSGVVGAFSGSAGAFRTIPWSLDAVVLPAERLDKILSSLAAQGHAEADISLTEARASVKAGGFRAQLPLFAGGDMSQYVMRAAPEETSPLGERFWDDVARTEPTANRDESRPAFCGVFWCGDGALVSTDNFRMTLRAADAGSTGCPVPEGLLIPNHLLQALPAPSRKGFMSAAVEENALWFFGSGAEVYGLLIDAQFPAAGRSEHFGKVRADAAAGGTWVELPGGKPLDAVIGRLLYFAEPPTFRMAVEVGADSVKLSVAGADGGDGAEEILPAKVEGGLAAFHVNAQHFRDAMAIRPRFWSGAKNRPLYVCDESKGIEHLVSMLSD